MKKILLNFITFLLLLGLNSCLKQGLEDLPEFSENDITGINTIEYRYIGSDISPVSGQPIVEFVRMSHTATIDKTNKSIEIIVSKPDNFPASELAALAANKLVVIVNLSTAARINPEPGSPAMGVVGDWSKPNVYKVTSADGKSSKWTIILKLV